MLPGQQQGRVRNRICRSSNLKTLTASQS